MNKHTQWLRQVTMSLTSRMAPTRTETELDQYQLMRMVDVHGVATVKRWILHIEADLSGSQVGHDTIEDQRRI